MDPVMALGMKENAVRSPSGTTHHTGDSVMKAIELAKSGADGKPHHSTVSNLLRLQGSCILALEETEPGGLADDGSLGSPIVIETRVAGGGVVAPGDAGGGDAPIRVCGEDTTGLVHRKVIEVQQVSGSIGARRALGTDHAELHSIIRRGVHSEPSPATVVSGGDVAVPHTVEWSWASVRSCGIAGRGRTQEEEGRTVVVTGNDFWEDRIADAEGHSDIQVTVPRAPLIVGNGDVRMSISGNVAKIYASFGADAYGWVARVGSASGNRLHGERETVIHGDDQALRASAAFIGEVHYAARANLNVTVQATAIQQRVHGAGSIVGQPAVLTKRHCGIADILRRVVDSMRILREGATNGQLRAGRRSSKQLIGGTKAERSAADGLMIDTGGDAAALTYGIAFAVVVCKSRETGGAKELRDDGATGLGIREEDGIQSSDACVWAILE